MADSTVFGLVMLLAFSVWCVGVYMVLHSDREY